MADHDWSNAGTTVVEAKELQNGWRVELQNSPVFWCQRCGAARINIRMVKYSGFLGFFNPETKIHRRYVSPTRKDRYEKPLWQDTEPECWREEK